MKTFSALLTFVQYSRAVVEIKAHSLEDAQRQADEIQSDEIEDWNPVEGNITVESVIETEGEQS